MQLIWLIPLLPAAGAAVNGVFGVRWFSRTVAAAVACVAMAGALSLSAWAFAALCALPPDRRAYEVVLGHWIPPIPLATVHGVAAFQVPWAVRLDPLSALMILVVTGIGLLIHLYSATSMMDEARGGYARFFCYLNLFCAFMLVLVLASNFLVLFLGWEGVALCSYLLVGFWYEKPAAASAGRKAFIVNRIGDWGFVLGICLVFYVFGTLDFQAVARAASSMAAESGGFGILSGICLLLFVGATGKSAQIPLFVWLPDAMEGPTPVSALIHAATMVTAGVYVVARNAVLFEHAPLVMEIVAIVGALTALLGATIALVQHDIKRILAFSTVSELGCMFLATGVGAFAAAVFHLTTHAFFKSLLFLGSGSVIRAMAGEQDVRRMGDLKKHMPVTCVTMMVGTLAIAGIPPLSGFFSKDEVLYRTFLGNRILWLLAAVTALVTAFYMFRLMALTFFGSYRGGAPWSRAASSGAAAGAAVHDIAMPKSRWHGPRESPGGMTGPLMALAVGAIVAGLVGVPPALGGRNALEHFLAPSFHTGSTGSTPAPARSTSGAGSPERTSGPAARADGQLALMLLSIAIAITGLLVARHFYLGDPALPGRLVARWSSAHSLLFNSYYVDELYNATIVRGTVEAGRGLSVFDLKVVDGAILGWSWLTRILSWCSHMVDKYAVDGLASFVGWSAGKGSFFVRRVQTGLVQNYALAVVLGLVAFLTIYLFAR